MTNSSNRSCQDYSPHCMTILAKSCKMPLQADVCKSTCGLCNDNHLPLPSQPRPPLPLKGKQLDTIFHLKTIDGIKSDSIGYN